MYVRVLLCSILFLFIVQTADGEEDMKKGTQLLEIYALEIQMYTAQVSGSGIAYLL